MPISAEQCRFRWFLGQEQGSIEQCNGLGSRLTSHRVNISFWFPRTWLNVWAPAPMHSSSSSSNRRSAFKRCSHSGSDKSSEMFCLDKRRENTGKFFLHLNWNTFTFKQSQSPPGASHSQIKRKKRACLNRGCEIWWGLEQGLAAFWMLFVASRWLYYIVFIPCNFVIYYVFSVL